LERLGIEVEVDVGGAHIWLVAEHATVNDRIEMTFREALVLAQVLSAFPGSRMVAITRRQNGTEEDQS
jgi:hypothetical protein